MISITKLNPIPATPWLTIAEGRHYALIVPTALSSRTTVSGESTDQTTHPRCLSSLCFEALSTAPCCQVMLEGHACVCCPVPPPWLPGCILQSLEIARGTAAALEHAENSKFSRLPQGLYLPPNWSNWLLHMACVHFTAVWDSSRYHV